MVERQTRLDEVLLDAKRRSGINTVTDTTEPNDLEVGADWPLRSTTKAGRRQESEHALSTRTQNSSVDGEGDDTTQLEHATDRYIPSSDKGKHDVGQHAPRDSGRVVDMQAVAGAEVSPVHSDGARPGSQRQSMDSTSVPSSTAANQSIVSKQAATRNNGIQDRDEQDEQQDDTPPMPSDLFQVTGVQQARMPPATERHIPRSSIDNAQHARQGSIARNSISGGYHSRQSSHALYSTAQIPYNRERVRYSWQSIQEDGSNRPRIHIIKLVSNTTSASSAFPQGEAFGFSMSPSGRRIAAYDSSRLYILQTAALPVGISQDFSLKRRPLAVELNDDGNLIAILADEHTVNVYDLSNSRVKRLKTFKLDFPASCIAVAPSGGLVAVAYEGGIEVFSLAVTALDTDRRAVRAPRMDRLAFSDDGSTLLGTTTRIHAASTVIINVPVFPASPDDIATPEELKAAWCSELLHPENIRNSSHAIFMRENRRTSNEHIFAWNGSADMFGILNTSDLEYGQIEFPIVIQPPLSTCGGLGAAIHSCPSIDEFGDTVAMIVNDRTIRLYVIPQKSDEGESVVEAHSIDHELDEGYGCPFNELRWVHSHSALPAPIDIHARVKGRLVVTSSGGVYGQAQTEESFEEVEGGRIILFDFDAQFSGQPGQTFVLNLGKSPPQALEEEEFDVASAVALVRRRTVKQSKAGDLGQRPMSLGRAATTAANPYQRSDSMTWSPSTTIDSFWTSSLMSPVFGGSEAAGRSLPDLLEDAEHVDALEEPFSMTAPRSQASLQRSASNVQRHRVQTLEERNQEGGNSDGHGSFLALPEYTAEPNTPLPSRFRAMAGLDRPASYAPRTTIAGLQRGSVMNSPMSAPPALAETFSAEQAFAAANATITSHPGSMMPRGLLRAYSNAAGPSLGSQPRTSEQRFSSPLTSLSETHTLPRRSSSTRRPGDAVYGSFSSSRSLAANPHRQSYVSASIFPQTQPSDHIPLPVDLSSQALGGVAHPVTSWRPPAASLSSQSLPATRNNGPTSRGHYRKGSVAGNRQAFASTAKAKKLGFFKKRERSSSIKSGMTTGSKKNASTPDLPGQFADSVSVSTRKTGPSNKKCAVM